MKLPRRCCAMRCFSRFSATRGMVSVSVVVVLGGWEWGDEVASSRSGGASRGEARRRLGERRRHVSLRGGGSTKKARGYRKATWGRNDRTQGDPDLSTVKRFKEV